jgi:Zn-dependent M28 family amino/carboxypeptidase
MAMEMDGPLEGALRRHVEALSVEIGPRAVLRGDGLGRARAYIARTFAEAGLAVTEQVYDFHGAEVANLVATPAGTAPAFHLIGAHYDTVPGTPGADDNASAVAVLLELARRVAARGASIPLRFAAFTLEEPPAFLSGAQGSRVFVERLAPGEAVLGAIVLEMVGYTSPRQHYPLVLRWAGYPDHGRFIALVGNWRSRRLARQVFQGFTRNPGLPVARLVVPFDGWVLPATRLSDHASFWDAGWPALMVTDTAFFRNPHYHLPSDRIETLDFGFMAELVESLELAIEVLGE